MISGTYPEPGPSYRYVVLDENGGYLNTILIAAPFPDNYHPGYGRYLAYAGPDPAPPEPGNPEVAPKLTLLNVRPLTPMSIGCHMNIDTGEVTYPPTLALPEEEPAGDESYGGA